MLSLTFFLTLLVLFIILQKFKNHSFLRLGKIVIINCFIIEALSYIILLFLVFQGGNFFLIGNQKFLDFLLKATLISKHQESYQNPYSLYQNDNYLGYTVGRNKYTFQHKSLNNQSMRSTKNYSLIPQEDKLRILTIGDSFVFCDDEYTHNCWTHILENNIGNLEVLNLGVSGYGLGQSYLRYLREGLAFKPDILLLNYFEMGYRDSFHPKTILNSRSLTTADIYRVNFWIEDQILKTKTITTFDLFDPNIRKKLIYKPIVDKSILLNPLFAKVNSLLLIKQSLLPKVLEKNIKESDEHYRQETLSLKILDNLLKTAQLNGTTVVFTKDINFQKFSPRYKLLFKKYENTASFYPAENVMKGLLAGQGKTYKEVLNHSNHYDPTGNIFYAKAISMLLEGRVWGNGNRVFMYNKDKNAFLRIKAPQTN